MALDTLKAMDAFVRVVETGSFSAVGKARGISQSSVSKLVAALEADLATRLLNRTTRSVKPTEAGARYYARCKSVLAAVQEADQEARFGQTSVRGRLRVNTSAALAATLLLPALLEFLARYPLVEPELIADERRIDPIGEDVDLIVRIGALSSSTLTGRRAGAARIGFFAAPSYLAEAGPPVGIAELRHHSVIGLSGRRMTPPAMLSRGDVDVVIDTPLTGHVTVSSSHLAMEAAALGAGIAVLPAALASAALEQGRLVEVLADVRLPPIEVSLLHAFGSAPPLQVSSFMDFATELWRARRMLD